MGYLRPTAIIVGGSYEDYLDQAHTEAHAIFGRRCMGQLISEVVDGIMNHERSFFIAWDGSKEGWQDSDDGDECRAEFVAWLREQAYSDGSAPLDWVEIQFGGDDGVVVALSHGDEARS